MSIRIPTPPEPAAEPFYPAEDGEPMADTETHSLAIIHLLELLKIFLGDRPDDYVVADIFWYYERGNPAARKAPDIMVVKGVGKHIRRSFFSWLENDAVPSVIFEFSSQNT